MEEKELFEKVYINFDSDLPKETGAYFCEGFNNNKQLMWFDPTQKSYWEDIKWYLRPIQQDTITTHDLKEIDEAREHRIGADISLLRDCWSSACASGHRNYPSLDKMQKDFEVWLKEAQRYEI